jgi:hypothetical protein
MQDSDERYNKCLSIYPKEESNYPDTKKYDGYREYPVSLFIDDNTPKVILDINFVRTCYDFGRFLSFNNKEEEEAFKEATEFADKLIKPIQGIVYSGGDSKEYDRDILARTFGMAFINNGFFHSSNELTSEKITELANYIVLTLEEMGYLK